ncbi:hypothetical protein WR25_09021 [Diploscapter pachys]|uniref:Uncharacterized protein n=1 Tax=Diploscapter pachys TaxID=2018661 RepID=A0A2A2M191_9BILA|nr:hypothetical protein WR25_09021 [Diploscapter pachys]
MELMGIWASIVQMWSAVAIRPISPLELRWKRKLYGIVVGAVVLRGLSLGLQRECGRERRGLLERRNLLAADHVRAGRRQQAADHEDFKIPFSSILPADVILGLPMPGRSSSMLTLQVQTCISSSHIVTTNVTENSTHFTELDEAAIEQMSTREWEHAVEQEENNQIDHLMEVIIS